MLDEPFQIQRDVTIPAGVYRFYEWTLTYNSNPARRFYERFNYSPQTFYDGTRHDFDATLGLRATSRASAEFTVQRNDVDLPWGDVRRQPRHPAARLRPLAAHDAPVAVAVQLVDAPVQHERPLQLHLQPGSDLYVVYDGLQGNLPGRPDLRNQQIVLKMTYLLSR